MQKTTTTRALVASIHDVSPLTLRQCERILQDLKKIGCRTTSLLVIPDHHRLGSISRDTAFTSWLRDRVAEGHEAVLHGYYHLRDRCGADGLFKRIVTQSYTAGEGEFFDLGREEAIKRLKLGLSEFAACGLEPVGFIAPAWLLGQEAEEAVRELRFEYTTRIACVSDFRTETIHHSRSLVWSVRAVWRRVCSLAWNRLLASSLRDAGLLRIGIHPPDWDHSSIRNQILSLSSAALAGRRSMTYQQWLAATRAEQ
ncbi:MAG: polysaccharide deacetylase family protein [bacterium]